MPASRPEQYVDNASPWVRIMSARKRSQSTKRPAKTSPPRAVKKPAKKSVRESAGRTAAQTGNSDPREILAEVAPQFVIEQLLTTATPKRPAKGALSNRTALRDRANELNLHVDPNDTKLLESIGSKDGVVGHGEFKRIYDEEGPLQIELVKELDLAPA